MGASPDESMLYILTVCFCGSAQGIAQVNLLVSLGSQMKLGYSCRSSYRGQAGCSHVRNTISALSRGELVGCGVAVVAAAIHR